MKDLKDWTESTKGIYRYVVAANACYEIHILHRALDTDILTSKASLFIAGVWRDKLSNDFFKRECLLSERPLFECIEAAIKDNEENNK